jgi:hypothetical protein
VFSHLEAWVCVGRGIPHSKDTISLLIIQCSKDTCVKKLKNLFRTNKKQGTQFSAHPVFVVSISVAQSSGGHNEMLELYDLSMVLYDLSMRDLCASAQ